MASQSAQCVWADCNAPIYRKHIHPATLFEQNVCLTHWAFLRHTDVIETHTRQLGEQKQLLTSLVSGFDGQQQSLASLATSVESQTRQLSQQQQSLASLATSVESQTRQLSQQQQSLVSLATSVHEHTRQLSEQQQSLASLSTSVQSLVEGQQELIEVQKQQSRILERHETLLTQLTLQDRGLNGDATA